MHATIFRELLEIAASVRYAMRTARSVESRSRFREIPFIGHPAIQAADAIAGWRRSSHAPARSAPPRASWQWPDRPVPALRPPAAAPACSPHAPSLHAPPATRSEEHTSELQSLMRISYA